jgi:hypothetical protein
MIDQGPPRLTDAQRREILRLRAAGKSYEFVAAALGIGRMTVIRAVHWLQQPASDTVTHPAITLYRAEKAKRSPRIAALIDACRSALAAEDDARLAQYGGAQGAARRRANAQHAARVRHAQRKSA